MLVDCHEAILLIERDEFLDAIDGNESATNNASGKFQKDFCF